MTPIDTLRNIGPKTREWLIDAGIDSVETLHELGAVETYMRLKRLYPDRVSLNALWGLQAALMDMPWTQLPDDIKAELRAQVAAWEDDAG